MSKESRKPRANLFEYRSPYQCGEREQQIANAIKSKASDPDDRREAIVSDNKVMSRRFELVTPESQDSGVT
jgi:hypothetical protein